MTNMYSIISMLKVRIWDMCNFNDRIKYFIKRNMCSILKTHLFTKNPFYKYFYYKKIRSKIPKLLQNIHTVVIEPTNYCNISCFFCPHKEMSRTKGYMEFELYKHIIDECKREAVNTLLMYGMGEPLLDKNYFEKIRYAKDQGIPEIECTSNGILLNEENAKALVDSGLTRLLISTDAASSDVYQKIHKNENFEIIVENIRGLIEYRSRRNKNTPRVIVRFRTFSGNIKDLKLFRKVFTPLVDHIKVDANILSWPGSTFDAPLFNSGKLIRFPCYNLWTQLYISHNGKVGLCCLDYDFKDIIGDVRTESLRKIWDGEILNHRRRLHLDGKSESIPLCSTCMMNTQIVSPWWLI